MDKNTAMVLSDSWLFVPLKTFGISRLLKLSCRLFISSLLCSQTVRDTNHWKLSHNMLSRMYSLTQTCKRRIFPSPQHALPLFQGNNKLFLVCVIKTWKYGDTVQQVSRSLCDFLYFIRRTAWPLSCRKLLLICCIFSCMVFWIIHFGKSNEDLIENWDKIFAVILQTFHEPY